MIAALTACALLFALAVTGWSLWFSQRAVHVANIAVKQSEIDALKKVGGWYESRVAELEVETTVLAAQVVQAGVVPIKNAMPFDPPPDEEWAYDATGLVRDRLDPREVSTPL